MPTFAVTCAHRETGSTYQVLITASSERQAANRASDDGHIVGGVTLQHAPLPAEIMLRSMERPSRFSLGRVAMLLLAIVVVIVATIFIIGGVNDLGKYGPHAGPYQRNQ